MWSSTLCSLPYSVQKYASMVKSSQHHPLLSSGNQPYQCAWCTGSIYSSAWNLNQYFGYSLLKYLRCKLHIWHTQIPTEISWKIYFKLSEWTVKIHNPNYFLIIILSFIADFQKFTFCKGFKSFGESRKTTYITFSTRAFEKKRWNKTFIWSCWHFKKKDQQYSPYNTKKLPFQTNSYNPCNSSFQRVSST